MCAPLAGEAELLAGALDEQALIPVIAAIAEMTRAAADIRRYQDRVGSMCMLLSPCSERTDIRVVGGPPGG
jgi:hypothetical protein